MRIFNINDNPASFFLQVAGPAGDQITKDKWKE